MHPRRSEHAAVAGLGWGDEGKGKVVDLLSPGFAAVVRYNGGANAGHTVCVGGETFALHLVPSGVLHPGVAGVIGPGVALDPHVLLEEIDHLASRGVDVSGKLKISDRAHIVAEHHKVEDRLSEQAASDETRIGTTARGIGPCYADKMRRSSALRACDLLDEAALRRRLVDIVDAKVRALRAVYGDDGGLTADGVWRQLADCAARLRPFICDTTEYLQRAAAEGGRFLFEAANGMLLDVDHGTYPFVTSSSTGTWGICSGAGIPPQMVRHYVGIIKAYATRVGAGPFPSELTDAVGDRIRNQGNEFGTTTGRPRRCGWFDAVAVGQGVRLGGITEIALMHLDTLSGLEQVGICTDYRLDGHSARALPADSARVARIEPVFEMLPGWTQDLRAVTRAEDLPAETLRYVQRIEERVGAPVTLVGVGPDRSQALERPAAARSVFAPPGGPRTETGR